RQGAREWRRGGSPLERRRVAHRLAQGPRHLHTPKRSEPRPDGSGQIGGSSDEPAERAAQNGPRFLRHRPSVDCRLSPEPLLQLLLEVADRRLAISDFLIATTEVKSLTASFASVPFGTLHSFRG